MTDTPQQVAGVMVSDVLGWRFAEDKKLILIGINDGSGGEFALAVSPENAFKVARNMFDAAGQAYNERGMQAKMVLSLDPEWFEVGTIEGSDGVTLSFYMQDKTAFSFHLPKAMAERLLDVLAVTLGRVSMTPPSGTTQH